MRRSPASSALMLTAAMLVFPAAADAQHATSVPAPDGGRIQGDVYGDGDHAVVLAHGGRYDRSSWQPQAEALAAAGFKVLAIDLRAAVRMRENGDTACLYDAACLAVDVLAAVRSMRAAGARSVSIVGASLGGGAAAQAAIDAAGGEIDRVVLLAPMAVASPERMQGRKLFVVSRDDPGPGGVPRLGPLLEQYDRTPEPKELLLLEGSAHAQEIFHTPDANRLMTAIVRFLSAR